VLGLASVKLSMTVPNKYPSHFSEIGVSGWALAPKQLPRTHRRYHGSSLMVAGMATLPVNACN
jgi:hypothetical protein